MYRQRLRCLPFQQAGQAQIPAGCTNADLISAAFCIEIMEFRLIIGKAAFVQRKLHLLALTGLQGLLGKTFQFPSRTVTLALGRCYIELHRFLAGHCACIFCRNGDLYVLALTDGAAAQPEIAVCKGRVGQTVTEGEQNIRFFRVVVAVADKYALGVNAGLPLAGEGKISRGVTQPPGEGLCQLAAGVFYAQQHFSTARTDKESYILFYTLRGAGLIEQGESHVELRTGQALLLNCRTPQSYCTAPGQSCWHHYWVHLDGAGVAAMEPLLLPGKKLTPVQLTGVKMQEYFETLLGQMERSTVDGMVTAGLALHEMLALCARSILAQAEATSARQVILQAAEILRKNYQRELCLADLLAEAHMSKSYFLRLFRRYMGTTPYNYLVNFRITQAKELLVLTDHSVSEVAQEVGFGDASNFSTRFAKATGQSPLQYRKSARAFLPVSGHAPVSP